MRTDGCSRAHDGKSTSRDLQQSTFIIILLGMQLLSKSTRESRRAFTTLPRFYSRSKYRYARPETNGQRFAVQIELDVFGAFQTRTSQHA